MATTALHQDAPAAAEPSAALPAFLDDIAGVPVTTDRQTVRRRSRDFFWYSPVLNAELAGKSADAIVTPRNEGDMLRVAAAAVRHGVPITPRGSGTGNYGQAVPLAGGIVLDMSALQDIEWQRPGMVRAAAGAKMHDIDVKVRPSGFELRMHPSTKRSATIGGFVAGGSGGIGSINYGGLRDRGNVVAARIVSLEAEPRVIDLRGDAVQNVNHAYGTTGIITTLEMPLAPAWPWIDVIVACNDFFAAVEIANEVALADGIVKKLITPLSWPLPSFFGPLRPYSGKSLVIFMIAAPSLESFKALLTGRGEITLETACDESADATPLYEYTWNHTTLHMLKADRAFTYLQCLLPHDRLTAVLGEIADQFPDELIQHLEFIRFDGRVTASALPILRYTTKARLDEIIAVHEAAGILIANPHVVTLEDGSSHRRVDADQLGFKHVVDPFGLLNPGKMRSFVAAHPGSPRMSRTLLPSAGGELSSQ
jgi:FAD/FMN-containing dehydrogenase